MTLQRHQARDRIGRLPPRLPLQKQGVTEPLRIAEFGLLEKNSGPPTLDMKIPQLEGARLARSGERATLDLGVVSSSPTVGAEMP